MRLAHPRRSVAAPRPLGPIPFGWIAPLLLIWFPACGGAAEPRADAPSESGASEEPAAVAIERRPIDSTQTGSIRGVVRFDGEAPLRYLEDVPDQPGCHEGHADGPPLSDFMVVHGGAIQNVIVHVRSGLEPWIVPPAEPQEKRLIQSGCIYRPHVLTMRTGDTLRVVNEDPTTHNVNSSARRNKAFNSTQGAGGKDITVVMEQAEIVPLRCDIHPWMSAHIGVFEHPFVGVTNSAGEFVIEGLPPGTYEIEAVHPDNKKIGKRGKAKATVSVAPGEAAEAEITFDS